MGGSGSGNWFRGGKRLADEYAFLDIAYLKRQGYLQPERLWSVSWTYRGEPGGSITGVTGEDRLTLLYKYRRQESEWEQVKQSVALTYTPCHYGGERPWFLCSGVPGGRSCGRRVGVLYAAGKYFLCRHCYDLAYQSQREDLSGRYMGRFHKIRRRLLDLCTPDQARLAGPADLPPRPKGMHSRTYGQLRQQARFYEQLGLAAIVACIEGLAIFQGKESRKRAEKKQSRWR